MAEAIKLTPMMKQYMEVKERCRDKILFFRLGDFYEMFFEDALTVSRELDLTLTGRAGGNKEKVPMCGVPFHSADTYIERLVQKGYKVAVCEQMEDPKAAKGIVKREIIKVITPGTITMEHAVAAKQNNYLACMTASAASVSFVLADVTTGECWWQVCDTDGWESIVGDMVSVYAPRELLLGSLTAAQKDGIRKILQQREGNCVLTEPDIRTDVKYEAVGTQYFTVEMMAAAKAASYCLGLLLSYVTEVMKCDISYFHTLEPLQKEQRLVLDAACLHHLEITRNVRDGGRKGTLLAVLDHTCTAMGGRLLRKWLETPLLSGTQIMRRQEGVAELVQHSVLRKDVTDILEKIYDFERILTRIETGTVSPKDYVALRESLGVLPTLKQALQQVTSPILRDLIAAVHTHDEVYDLLCRSIKEVPGQVIRNGGVIREGFSSELDEIRRIGANSKEFLQELEAKERERTGIKMKIGYTKVFGYYFEISHANTKPVPEYYIRKQTLVNAERYITPALKEFEVKVLTAQERMLALEYALYGEVRQRIQTHIHAMQETARALAQLDCLHSLAVAAQENRYIRPQLNGERQIRIVDGRHPIMEHYVKNALFVPNDVVLNHDTHEILIITGPNMAGKSTYMRQVAVLVLMTQIGSFIPAREASICPVDRIFTRIGATDDILTGQSTFMMEMEEVSHILQYATQNSLLILDEIGRGTSTFDGMSIARAVIEYCLKKVHALTLFATHYHELTDMSTMSKKIKNYTVAVKERGRDITFLRRIIPGGADRSYGLHVARLAGLPEGLLKRAEVILQELETAEHRPCQVSPSEKRDTVGAEGLFANPVLTRLLEVDINGLTPIEAISFLYALQKEAKEGSGVG